MRVREAMLVDSVTIAEFNLQMAWETEALKLDADVVLAGVRELIQSPQRGFYLVAEREQRVVGVLMVTTEWSDWHNATYWWIQSVYVRPSFRRQGTYRELYRHVKKLAQQQDSVRSFRLYVERDNVSAQKTYRSLGMTETAYRVFEEVVAETP